MNIYTGNEVKQTKGNQFVGERMALRYLQSTVTAFLLVDFFKPPNSEKLYKYLILSPESWHVLYA